MRRNKPRRGTIVVSASQNDDDDDDDDTKAKTSTTSPPPPSRLFSNLDGDLAHAPGSVVDAAALVAGTTVGAGVLAIPQVTEPAGFAAAAPALVLAWLFSAASGLLLAEASLSFLCSTGRGGGSLLSLTRSYLGEAAAGLAAFCYVFLHLALLVAYIAKGGALVAGVLETSSSSAFSFPSDSLPQLLLLPLSAVAFTAVLGSACYLLPPRRLDEANSVLVAGVVASFAALVAVALTTTNSSSSSSSASVSASVLDLGALSRADWAQLPPAVPVLALAFVFQNVVSVVVSSLEGDSGKVRTAILLGTLAPLLMFLSWDAVSLGSAAGASFSSSPTAAADPVAALSASSPLAGPLVATFSLLALVTSFFGFVLGLTDFLADALPTTKSREEKGETSTLSLRSLLPVNPSGRARAPTPYALTLLPPLAGAIAVPGAFVSALSVAGTYGVMFLFGLLPPALASEARKRRAARAESETEEERENDAFLASFPPPLVPGGDVALWAVGGTAAAVIVNETVSRVAGLFGS